MMSLPTTILVHSTILKVRYAEGLLFWTYAILTIQD